MDKAGAEGRLTNDKHGGGLLDRVRQQALARKEEGGEQIEMWR